ncbi:hypothetical protein OH77DRAFT_1423710 [Trametes cingulata]|nr:hypothetical protein OH77DRAFT_1423710 [Trametes cingulata]
MSYCAPKERNDSVQSSPRYSSPPSPGREGGSAAAPSRIGVHMGSFESGVWPLFNEPTCTPIRHEMGG